MRSAQLKLRSGASVVAAVCIAVAACTSGTSPDQVSNGIQVTNPDSLLASRLAFTPEPTGPMHAVQVSALDSKGNVAPSFTGTVTLSVISDSGPFGGTTAVAAVAGIATFSNLLFIQAGYVRFIASSTGLPPDTSATFLVTPSSVTTLVFTVQPTNTAANAVIAPSVRVCAMDGFVNVDSTFAGVVFVDLGNDPGSSVLIGTNIRRAVSGCATFSDLSMDKASSGYTLRARAPLALSTSIQFNIGP